MPADKPTDAFRLMFQAHPWHGVPAGSDAPSVVSVSLGLRADPLLPRLEDLAHTSRPFSGQSFEYELGGVPGGTLTLRSLAGE